MPPWDHWTTGLVGAASAIVGAAWLVIRGYYQARALARDNRIADARADVEVAKAEAEAERARDSTPNVEVYPAREVVVLPRPAKPPQLAGTPDAGRYVKRLADEPDEKP
jgi:hypothetical protein